MLCTKCRYGIANEAKAKATAKALQWYKDVLKHTGQDTELQSVGLFADPEQPWLRASPDAIVYDPAEASPLYGIASKSNVRTA